MVADKFPPIWVTEGRLDPMGGDRVTGACVVGRVTGLDGGGGDTTPTIGLTKGSLAFAGKPQNMHFRSSVRVNSGQVSDETAMSFARQRATSCPG